MYEILYLLKDYKRSNIMLVCYDLIRELTAKTFHLEVGTSTRYSFLFIRLIFSFYRVIIA